VQLGAALVAGAEAAEVVKPGEAALDHPAFLAEARIVIGLAACDDRLHPSLSQLATVPVVVIAAIGEQAIRSPAGPTDLAGHRSHRIHQGQQLGDVVAVATGQGDRQRHAGGIGDQVVPGAGAGTVDRRRPCQAPPCNARM
jgi:hypothetical protein